MVYSIFLQIVFNRHRIISFSFNINLGRVDNSINTHKDMGYFT
jgi:hypothetical protein